MNLCDIFILISIIINKFSLWISSTLAIDITLFNIYIGTMRVLSAVYAIIISFFFNVIYKWKLLCIMHT